MATVVVPGIGDAGIFKPLENKQEISFAGELKDKIYRYKIDRDDACRTVLTQTIIHRNDRSLWESFQGLLVRSIQNVQPLLRGLYSFDVLAIDMLDGLEYFNWLNFETLLSNYIKKIKVTETCVIRYCSLFAVLKQHTQADFGSIKYSFPVKTYDKADDRFDLFLKRLVTAATKENNVHSIIVHDLSATPIYSIANAEQTERLNPFLEKVRSQVDEAMTVYIVDRNGMKMILT